MITKDELAANLSAVEARIAAACAKAGRPRASVTLVAVSKKHPPELIRLAWELGHLDFGENYAQELRDKAQALSDCAGLRWHAIGPVQPKNAKYLAKAAHVFHALERLEVAQELSRRRTGGALPCLLEVNVAGEATKAGLAPAEVEGFLAQVRGLPNLEAVGLTAMPPFVDDPQTNRPHFEATARLATSLGLSQLSMGTTSDFEAAVACGATLIRVGTAIFGERPAAP
ncbi:MAG: YggS family pyridoxal phosphate-dependent enzyme [Myxococcales bacterium]|nr:YggS family pyridoxal phosphate-dependent enzyme [Myxococcales bacterium]